jgi:NAD(P)-dependent dehydrogenase (short-subunit alcohol dehydrogenase family)
MNITEGNNYMNNGTKNALITGSSSGIGAAIAVAYAKKGINVGLTYNRHREGGEHTKKLCEAYGVKVELYQAELSDKKQCIQLMENFLRDFKTIDILVNNAGGALKIPAGEFEDLPLDYWDSQIALNLSAAAYCSQYAIRNMKENNIKGNIINISSVHGTVSWVKRKFLPYCAGKGGLDMLTKALAVEVAPYGIRINGIAPGFIMTSVSSRYSDEQMKNFTDYIPANCLGTTDDVVPMALFLAAEENTRFIVGQTFHIDGGQSVTGMIPAMKEDFEKL